jgi:hypothetical protein
LDTRINSIEGEYSYVEIPITYEYLRDNGSYIEVDFAPALSNGEYYSGKVVLEHDNQNFNFNTGAQIQTISGTYSGLSPAALISQDVNWDNANFNNNSAMRINTPGGGYVGGEIVKITTVVEDGINYPGEWIVKWEGMPVTFETYLVDLALNYEDGCGVYLINEGGVDYTLGSKRSYDSPINVFESTLAFSNGTTEKQNTIGFYIDTLNSNWDGGDFLLKVWYKKETFGTEL